MCFQKDIAAKFKRTENCFLFVKAIIPSQKAVLLGSQIACLSGLGTLLFLLLEQ